MTASVKEADASKPTETARKKATQLDHDKVTKDIAAAKELAQQNKIKESLEALLVVEKQARVAEDLECSKAVCTAILEVAHASGDWKQLLEHIVMLAKRRGQLKNAIQAMVQQATEMLDSAKSEDDKKELIKTLQAVTEGKIFVEIERARLTKRLARLYMAEGKVSDAADALQEMAVETFGAMHRSEKIAYVLLQMRLCMANKDFVRAQILSRKVSPRAFAKDAKGQEAGEISLQGTAIVAPEEGTPSMEDLKILYYNQMIEFHKEGDNYLEVCRCLLAIYTSDSVKDDAEQWTPLLKQIVWFLVLAPSHSTAQGSASDHLTLMTNTVADPRLVEVPDHKDLLTIFVTKEVAGAQALLARYTDEMKSEPSIFGGEAGTKRCQDFKTRITQHNIIVIAQYYTRLRTKRLATLVDLPIDEAEQHLSDLVVEGALHAKIDRPAGVIRFLSAKDSIQVLDQWGDSISKLLGIVDTACQMISKEAMQHKIDLSAPVSA